MKLNGRIEEEIRWHSKSPLANGLWVNKVDRKGGVRGGYFSQAEYNFCDVGKDDHFYAVKVINKLLIKKKPFLQKYIDQEIEIMKKLTHPNIVAHQHSFSSIFIPIQPTTSSSLLWSIANRETFSPIKQGSRAEPSHCSMQSMWRWKLWRVSNAFTKKISFIGT